MRPNEMARRLAMTALDDSAALRIALRAGLSGRVIDAGVEVHGGLEAGVLLARICLGDQGRVTLVPEDFDRYGSDLAVQVRTDQPLLACLGAQYAGWPVQTEGYFAMGSGPMRLVRGREEMLQELKLHEATAEVVGVLESDRLPDESVLEYVAEQCATTPQHVTLIVAPSTSLAGTVQVVARSIETAMHKLHQCQFDVTAVQSGAGVAPLPPPATDTVAGIGRTNDAILYGGRVTLWVDAPQEAVDAVGPRLPSRSSSDYGRPFAETFQAYGYDFYQVDPLLFSPAVVTLVNRRTGISRRFGSPAPEVLRQSFGLA